MADNTLLNSGTGGDTIATDDIGGVKYQRVKVNFGPDNSTKDAESNADATTSRGLPVETPASTATAALNALNAAVTLDLRNRAVGAISWEIDTGIVGTVTPEATLDNTNWFAVDAIQLDGTIITSTSSFPDRGAFVNKGFSQVRLRVSSFTSGSSNSRIAGLAGASDIVRIGDSLPPGTNNIGDVDILSLPNEGQQTMANSISVAVASDQSDLNIADGGNSITVDAPVATPVNVQISDGTDTALVSAAGAVNVDGSAVTQPISAASLPLPTGAATAAGQLADGHNVTVDNGGAGAAVNIQDGGNSITVDGTVAATQSGSWVLAANSGVDIGDVTINNGGAGAAVNIQDGGNTITVDGTVTASNAAGDIAHDSPDSGNPVKVGAVAESTESTAVADGDRTNLIASLNGKLVVLPYAVPERLVNGVTAAITGTANTSVIAAPGAGLRNYINHVIVTNSHASVDTVVEIKDGTTVLYRGFAKAAGGGFSCTLPSPLRLTANTALNAANVTTGSNTYVSASGFIAP